MKIKSIILKAFRLFDDERLDFVNRHEVRDAVANLVVIQAPNGFGKTSLFDAIEFAITRNIKRLKRNEVNFKENVQSDDKVSDNSSFIHNAKLKDSPLSVEVNFDGNISFTRHPDKNEEQSWLLGEPENGYFSTVMLAQDWFSAFLSTTNGEERFRMFLDNFEQTRGLLDYHENLKSTSVSLTRAINTTEREVSDLERKLKDAIADDIKDKLSTEIEALKQMGVDLNWNGHINERSLTALEIEAGQQSELLKHACQTLKERLQNCEDVREGHADLIPIEALVAEREQLAGLKKNVEEAQRKLQQVQRLKEIARQIDEHEHERQSLIQQNNRLQQLIGRRDAFVLLEQQRVRYEKEASQTVNAINQTTKSLALLTAEQQQCQIAFEQSKKLTVVAQNKLDTLEAKLKTYETLLKEGTEIRALLSDLEKKRDAAISVKVAQEKKLQELQQLAVKLTNRELDTEIAEYKEQSSAILILAQKIKQGSTELKKVQQQIDEQQHYMGQVEQLIVKSREMADTLKSGNCPLCGHHFETLELLLKSIESNKSVATATEALLVRKNELNKTIKANSTAMEAAYTCLLQTVTADLSTLQKSIEEQDKEVAGIILQASGKRQRETEIKQEIESDYKAFSTMTLEQLKAAYTEERDNARKLQNQRESVLTASSKKVDDASKQIETLNKKLDEVTSKSSQISEFEDYQNFKTLLNGEAFDDEAFKTWEQQQVVNNEKIASRVKAIGDLKAEQTTLYVQEKIAETMEPEVTANLENQKTLHTKLKEQYLCTIRFICDSCAVSGVEPATNPLDVVKRFEDTEALHRKDKEKAEANQQALLRFMALNEQAKKYWEQQKIRKELEAKQKKLDNEIESRRKVVAEKERLQSFLEEYVKNFFHLDLINRLYNTIDPHPVYKTIRFACDFNYKKPRLNVYMQAKRDEEGDIVPNLYFSTAQINILSFCIFMAKAMFARTQDNQDLGCIFIDDPIQALDDINILSMIDLIRNVAFTQDRQIILTTHDRNFFELLQKKMPQDKFNACYFKLRERGKFEQLV